MSGFLVWILVGFAAGIPFTLVAIRFVNLVKLFLQHEKVILQKAVMMAEQQVRSTFDVTLAKVTIPISAEIANIKAKIEAFETKLVSDIEAKIDALRVDASKLIKFPDDELSLLRDDVLSEAKVLVSSLETRVATLEKKL